MSPAEQDEIRAYAKRIVDQAPPLSDAQMTRLVAILRPAVQAATRTGTRAAGNNHTADAA